jgi:hypothetical protein
MQWNKAPGEVLFLREATLQLSSPQSRFTPEFGMGQGGSTTQDTPGKLLAAISRSVRDRVLKAA